MGVVLVKKLEEAEEHGENTERYQKEVTKQLESIHRSIYAELLTYDMLPELLAKAWATLSFLSEHNKRLRDNLGDYEQALSFFAKDNDGLQVLEMLEDFGNKAARLINRGMKSRKVAAARKAANTRHSRPGGSREKQEAIRRTWATGKYSSRDVCAEQECADLGMSFSAARRALRKTPDPKNYKKR